VAATTKIVGKKSGKKEKNPTSLLECLELLRLDNSDRKFKTKNMLERSATNSLSFKTEWMIRSRFNSQGGKKCVQ